MISFNLQPTGVDENFLPFGWKTTMTCTNTRIQIRNLSNFTTDAQTSGETMLEAAKASIRKSIGFKSDGRIADKKSWHT